MVGMMEKIFWNFVVLEAPNEFMVAHVITLRRLPDYDPPLPVATVHAAAV